MALKVIEPQTREHLLDLVSLMRGEPWDPAEVGPWNSLVLVDERDNVVGGSHYDLLYGDLGEIRFLKSASLRKGGGSMLLDSTLELLFKKVEHVQCLPRGNEARLSEFLVRHGFKRGLGGNFVINKGDWRARRNEARKP